jgi:Xaa-Pro aminopeptidase
MDKKHMVSSLSGPRMNSVLYAARLTDFAARMKPNSVAIIVANPERTRSNDTEFEFRQSSDLLYLTGFPEPEAALVVSKIGNKLTAALFVRPKDRAREVWTGIRHGVEGAKKSFVCDKAFTVDQFAKEVAAAIAKADTVYYKFGNCEHFDTQFDKVWKSEQRTLENPETIVHEMRLFKSERELDIMRHAGKIAAAAHSEAMRLCTSESTEYQLEAIIESVFRFNGSDFTAYNSIVAGGNNAVILHYTTNNDPLNDGDLMLVDAGCEYQGYASDITRGFPVNGKFSDAQRTIYQLVLDAQLAAIKVGVAGKTLTDVHQAASRVLRRGLFKLGIISKEVSTVAGERKALKAHMKAVVTAKKKGAKVPAEPVTLRSFFMHGTSHWLGLDVHDVGTGGTRDPRGKKRKLEPGMVFTVEPGLYFDKNDKRVPKQFRGIGVRIEDDVAIIPGGQEILSAGVPKEIDDIERLMAEGRNLRLSGQRVQSIH